MTSVVHIRIHSLGDRQNWVPRPSTKRSANANESDRKGLKVMPTAAVRRVNPWVADDSIVDEAWRNVQGIGSSSYDCREVGAILSR